MAMTENDLLRGIGSLEDKLVDEAEAYQAKPVRHLGRWIAAAACVAIVAGVGWKVLPMLTTETKPPQTVTDPDNTGSTVTDGPDMEAPAGETLGGIALGMTQEQVEAVLGSDYEATMPRQLAENYLDLSWYYDDLYVRFVDQGDGCFVREIMAPDGSTAALSTGITADSSEEAILAAYPDAEVSEADGVWSARIACEDSNIWIFKETENGNYINWIDPSSQSEPADPVSQESIGGLTLGMTTQEVEAILGTEYRAEAVTELRKDFKTVVLRYSDAELQFADMGDGWFLNQIHLSGDSTLTLAAGIGMDATEAEIRAAYPDVIQATEETDPDSEGVARTFLHSRELLRFYVDGGELYEIELGPLVLVPAPLWQSMSAPEITVQSADGTSVTLIDKAAKTVCTVLTITDPEPAEHPGESPQWWLDFGTGVYLAVYGHDDLATIYTGDELDTTGATMTEEQTGVYLDLDDTLASALANPTETWE